MWWLMGPGGWQGEARTNRLMHLTGMLATQGPYVGREHKDIVEIADNLLSEVERREVKRRKVEEEDRKVADARKKNTRKKIQKLVEEDWMFLEIDNMIKAGNYLYKTLCARIQEFESVRKPSKSVKDTIAHLRAQRSELGTRNQDLTDRRYKYKGDLVKELCEKHGMDHRDYYE